MSNGVLHITDSRTSRDYEIQIRRNVIKAVDFQAIKGPIEDSNSADQVGNGLRLFDPGFKNTAVSESAITFMYDNTSANYCYQLSTLTTLTNRLCSDGAQGIVQYRGHNITEFWQTAEFEDLLHLLVWGHWPSTLEKEAVKDELFKAAQIVPNSVKAVIYAFPFVLSNTRSEAGFDC